MYFTDLTNEEWEVAKTALKEGKNKSGSQVKRSTIEEILRLFLNDRGLMRSRTHTFHSLVKRKTLQKIALQLRPQIMEEVINEHKIR